MTLPASDRLDILDLLIRADDAASARDVEGYLSLLTGDMVLDGDQGTYQGTSALRHAFAAVWAKEQKASLHLTVSPVIDAGPQDQATARSVLLIVDPGPPPALAAAARITHELRREEGQWKISRRTVSAPGLVPEPPGHQPQEEP